MAERCQRETETEDAVSLSVLSESNLTQLANNPAYREILQDLLAPNIDKRSVGTDHTDLSENRRGTDPTCHDPAAVQPGGDVRVPDQRLTSS